jgi:hypothetical protein
MIPYGKTGSGHAGNDTSRERQEREDALGITSLRQKGVYALVTRAGTEGMVGSEVEEALAIHHGQASSALSHLHRAGYVIRLKMRRGRQEIYVHPDYVRGREESPYRPRMKPAKHPRDLSDDQIRGVMMDAGVDESFFNEVRRVINNLP